VTQAVVGLAIGGATLLLLAELFTGAGSGIDPFPQGSYLLLLMAITSFEVRSRANCYSSLVMAFLGIYAATSVAYSDLMAVVVGLFAATVLATLALGTREDLRRAASGPGGMGLVPAPPTIPERRRLGAPAALSVAVVLGGGLAYLALPPYEGPLPLYPVSADLQVSSAFTGQVLNPLLAVINAGSPTAPRSAYYGFAPELRLGGYGPLDSTVLMRVRSTGWSYWRMQTYDIYTGRSWLAASGYPNELDRTAGGTIEPQTYPQEDAAAATAGPTIRQTFTLVRGGPNLVAVADRPVRLYFPAAMLWQRVDAGDLLADQPLPAGTSYTVISRLPRADAALLRRAQGRDPWPVTLQDLALPEVPATVRLAARTAVAGASTRYDKVLAIIGYLQAHAHYDLTTPPVPPGQEAVATLLATGRGYCEQFATALTVLARLNGIPARLVTGFAPGDYDVLGRVYTVRASDAHAWTEIYFPGQGWIPFDATPSFAAQPQAHPTGSWLLGAMVGPHLPRPDWARLAGSGGAALGAGGAQLSTAAHTLGGLAGGTPILPAAAAMALLLATAALAGRAGLRAGHGPARPGERYRREILAAYLEAEHVLLRRGYPPRDASITPRRYARQTAPPGAGASLAELAELAMGAAYGVDIPGPADVVRARRLRHAVADLAEKRRDGRGRSLRDRARAQKAI
jgi:transglutaminase-like putative cysteine protease